MPFRSFLPTLVVFALSLNAADTPPKTDPPDRKAFMAALKIKDSSRKIEALEAFVRAYPKSPLKTAANMRIFDALVKSWPETSDDAIRHQAMVVIAGSKKDSRASIYDDVASTLEENGALLDYAEDLSKRAVGSLHEAKYIEREKKEYQQAKMKVPDDAELQSGFRREQANLETTLGLIYLAEGEDAKAGRILKHAYAADPNRADTGEALAELALKAGDENAAYDYLLNARISGNIKPASREELTALYAKRHGGSGAGFDELLDQTYRKRFPDPIHVDPYQPTASRSNRVVLAEVFTGAGCPPCAGADLAMDAAMERYPTKDLAVLMFHQHVPHPDPMANPDTVKRASFYDVQGVPTLAIDGQPKVGGSPRAEAKSVYDRFDPEIEQDLQKPAEAQIRLTATREGDVVKVRATVDNIKSDAKDLKLQIALIEEQLRYSGENGIRFHPMVVRAMAGKDAQGFDVEAGKSATFEWSFDLDKISSSLKSYLDDYEQNNERYGKITFIEKKYRIDPNDLAVAAFVQETKTRHVLQASFSNLSSQSQAAGSQ